MPMLVPLEGKYINKELKIIEGWFSYHIGMIVSVISRKLIKKVIHTREGSLLFIALFIIDNCRLSVNCHIKPHTLRETWHKLITSSNLNILPYWRGDIDADTCCSCCQRDIQMVENAIFIPILRHRNIVSLIVLFSLQTRIQRKAFPCYGILLCKSRNTHTGHRHYTEKYSHFSYPINNYISSKNILNDANTNSRICL